jgi:hypothetical protein
MDHLDETTLVMVRRREGTAVELARAVRHLEVCPSCLAAWRTLRVDEVAPADPLGATSREPRSIDWQELLALWQSEEELAAEESAQKSWETPHRHLRPPRRA